MWWEWSSAPFRDIHPLWLDSRRRSTTCCVFFVDSFLFPLFLSSHCHFDEICIIVCDYYLFKIGSFTQQQQHSTTQHSSRIEGERQYLNTRKKSVYKSPEHSKRLGLHRMFRVEHIYLNTHLKSVQVVYFLRMMCVVVDVRLFFLLKESEKNATMVNNV